MGLKLIAVGSALPKRVVTNADFAKVLDTSDEWIVTRTGIKSRYFCEDETTGDLAVEAARKAYNRSGLEAGEIRCVIVATMTPDRQVPNLACRIQQELGLPETIPAFDLNSACSGFLFSAAAARSFLADGGYALIVGAECMSQAVDQTDRSICVLFGDGAGAGIFTLTEDIPEAICLGSRGDEAIVKEKDEFLQMDGKAVFRFAVEAIPTCTNEVLTKSGWTLSDVDYVVCHQANERIIAHSEKKLAAKPGQFFRNLDHTGNTSAASIPLALAEMYERGLLAGKKKLILVGFGGGLTWGGMAIEADL